MNQRPPACMGARPGVYPEPAASIRSSTVCVISSNSVPLGPIVAAIVLAVMHMRQKCCPNDLLLGNQYALCRLRDRPIIRDD